MQPRGALTSRDTTFQAPPSPDKRRMTIKDMLKIAWQLGECGSVRNVAERTTWSPSSVHSVRQRALTDKGKEENPDFTRGFVAHFVAFSLFPEPVRVRKSDFRGSIDRGS